MLPCIAILSYNNCKETDSDLHFMCTQKECFEIIESKRLEMEIQEILVLRGGQEVTIPWPSPKTTKTTTTT